MKSTCCCSSECLRWSSFLLVKTSHQITHEQRLYFKTRTAEFSLFCVCLNREFTVFTVVKAVGRRVYSNRFADTITSPTRCIFTFISRSTGCSTLLQIYWVCTLKYCLLLLSWWFKLQFLNMNAIICRLFRDFPTMVSST